ncbi:hypothetical protein Tco_1407975 [Tanacetum coccineum]
MLATMNQIVNLLSGFQKQFPSTNNQLRTFTNPMDQANIHSRSDYNRGVFNDVLQEQRLNRLPLDSRKQAEAFLADVECTTPYVEPLAITTTQIVHDNEDTLVHAKVSRTKMLEKMKDPECPIISSPINYAKLNNLYDTFVPQKELTREQAYWLPANEVASNQSKPAQQFVHTRPAKSQVNSHLKTLKSCFPEFDEVIKFRTKPTCLTDGEWRFEHTKRCFVEQIIPFYEKLKTHVKGIEDNLFKEVSEYMKFLTNWTKSMINV